MNLSSSSNYFHIKNPISISFIQFKRSLYWASNPDKPRGYSTTNPETQSTIALDGGLFSRKQEVSYARMPGRKGMKPSRSSDQARVIQIKSQTGIPQQLRDLRSTVGDRPSRQYSLDRRIAHRRFGFKMTKGYPLI
jgi:hypothetical protein